MASRQDRATIDRHARTLRELVKLPANKVCADCKRNDARWASWNIGVFICIRCSGIHRSMGTHISKVKSVDLDVWTPEQMASIQKWGNVRANLYWEAHLKPGHQPPDHKLDSFIRSKYESRRWAMEGPPPSDPSVLERGAEASSSGPSTTTTPSAIPSTRVSPSTSVPTPTAIAPPVAATTTASRIPSPPKAHNLLSSSHVHTSSTSSVVTTKAAPAAPADDLFSLDFSAPQAQTVAPQKKDVKQDILSLFSSATPPQPAVPATGLWGQSAPAIPTAAAPAWEQAQATSQPSATTSTIWGQPNQVGWGSEPATWGASVGASVVPPSATSTDLWGAQTGYNNPLPAQNVWATTSSTQSSTGSTVMPSKKQDDAFGDLWGAFK